MKRKLIKTEDGSHTVLLENMSEHYHSTHGALNESMHVFIEAGLKHVDHAQKVLTVLEVGFGTGLNALLTLDYAISNKRKIQYVGLEPFPLEEELYQQLNYETFLELSANEEYLQTMHSRDWNFPYYYTDYFVLNKIQSTLQEAELQEAAFDVIYFDAFGPDKQSEVWTVENFRKCYQALKADGVLTTYSAKGQVKRDLQEVGFVVEKISGPKGKREMIRARKQL